MLILPPAALAIRTPINWTQKSGSCQEICSSPVRLQCYSVGVRHGAARVTVAMAAWESSNTVERSLKSLQSQDFPDWVAFVIVSKSEDTTSNIAHKLAETDERIQIMECSSGSSWVRSVSAVLAICDSEFFFVLDADDYVSSNWISSLIDALRETRGAGAAIGTLFQSDITGNELTHHPANRETFAFASSWDAKIRLRGFMLRDPRRGAVNLLYAVWRTSVLRSIGFWGEKGKRPDDDHLFALRALETTTFASIPNCYFVRTVPGSLGKEGSLISFDLPDEVRMRELDRPLEDPYFSPGYVRQCIRYLAKSRMRSWAAALIALRLWRVAKGNFRRLSRHASGAITAFLVWTIFPFGDSKRLVWGSSDARYVRFRFLGIVTCDVNQLRVRAPNGSKVPLVDSAHFRHARTAIARDWTPQENAYKAYIAEHYPSQDPQQAVIGFERTIEWVRALEDGPQILVRLKPFTKHVDIVDGAHRAAAWAALGNPRISCRNVVA